MTEPQPCPEFGFYAYADQFYDAFNKLGADHLHPSISWPRHFLLCHSIELALEAYLAKLGATPKQLKFELGHKLAELVDEAVGKGLRLTPETQDRIKALAKAHSNFCHRYPWEWENSDGVYVMEQFIQGRRQAGSVGALDPRIAQPARPDRRGGRGLQVVGRSDV